MHSGLLRPPLPSDLSEPQFDPDRILRTLEQNRVSYILVGGFAATAHGAARGTIDLDCVPNTDMPNLERLSAALRQLNARLRVAGMTDEESRQLPVLLDALTLASFGSSTWMTDAGPLDLLVDLRDLQGGRHPYIDLINRAQAIEVGGVVVSVAALADIIASKEFANRPKDHEALPELKRILQEREESHP